MNKLNENWVNIKVHWNNVYSCVAISINVSFGHMYT
jgi:hypothetical protein